MNLLNKLQTCPVCLITAIIIIALIGFAVRRVVR